MRLAVLLIVFAGGAAGGAPRRLNEAESERLMAAVLKEKPESTAIDYVVTVKDRSKSKADLEKQYENIFDQVYGPREALDAGKAAERDRMVRMNVASGLEGQEVGRTSRVRLRYRNDRLLINHIVFSSGSGGAWGEAALRDVNSEGVDRGRDIEALQFTLSRVETVDHDGLWMRHTYHHGSKTVTVTPIRKRSTNWTKDTDRFVTMPATATLKITLCDRTPAGAFVPNGHMMEQLRLGTLKDASVTINEEENVETKEKGRRVLIEIALCDSDGRPWLRMAMVCDREDYSKVYSYEGRTGDGRLIAKETRGDFDDQGFPHSVTMMRYDGEGKLVREQVYRVETVSVNMQIPDKAFEVESAHEYAVTEQGENR